MPQEITIRKASLRASARECLLLYCAAASAAQNSITDTAVYPPPSRQPFLPGASTFGAL